MYFRIYKYNFMFLQFPMGYLDYTNDFIFFPCQDNSQDYFNICKFKSLPKRVDTICHCFNHDRQLFYKDIFYFDPVEHFWFCGVCPHFYPTGLASCVEIPILLDLENRIFAKQIMNSLKQSSLLRNFIVNFRETLLGELTSLQRIFMIFRILGNQECPQLAVKVVGSIKNQFTSQPILNFGEISKVLERDFMPFVSVAAECVKSHFSKTTSSIESYLDQLRLLD